MREINLPIELQNEPVFPLNDSMGVEDGVKVCEAVIINMLADW